MTKLLERVKVKSGGQAGSEKKREPRRGEEQRGEADGAVVRSARMASAWRPCPRVLSNLEETHNFHTQVLRGGVAASGWGSTRPRWSSGPSQDIEDVTPAV